MPLYTVVVGDRPTFIFFAENESDAEDILKADEFVVKGDLLVLEDGFGRPLCDGVKPLKVPLATPAESELWREAYDATIEHGDPSDTVDPEKPEDWGCFSFPVHDPARAGCDED